MLEHINVTGGTEETVDGMASGGSLTFEEPFETLEQLSSFDKDLGDKKNLRKQIVIHLNYGYLLCIEFQLLKTTFLQFIFTVTLIVNGYRFKSGQCCTGRTWTS